MHLFDIICIKNYTEREKLIMKNEFLSKVFKWFGIGLLVTFLVAYFTSTNITLLSLIFSGYGYLIIFLLEIVLAVWLSSRIRKMDSGLTKGLYIGYSALTGLTFSSIFIVYEMSSIIFIFLATSIIFLIFSILGKNSKMNLTKLGTYLFVGLLSIVIINLINIFIMNNTLDIVLCVIGIIIFIGYVYYDINRIVNYYDDTDNMAVVGAFNLYLDFINIFLKLLRLFGKKRD